MNRKLFLSYLQGIQSNNQNLVSFQNSLRKNSWQKPMCVLEEKQSEEEKGHEHGDVSAAVSKKISSAPGQGFRLEPTSAVKPVEVLPSESPVKGVEDIGTVSRTTALLSTGAHGREMTKAAMQRFLPVQMQDKPEKATLIYRGEGEETQSSSPLSGGYHIPGAGTHFRFTTDPDPETGLSIEGSIGAEGPEAALTRLAAKGHTVRPENLRATRGRWLGPTSLAARQRSQSQR
jgi:hypothetical protein